MREIDRSPFKVHQALHGYDGGHRILACSREITGNSKLLFLQLSDRSSDINEIPEEGYLTAYPLIDEGVYVLSRTWAAPEMQRPGCVWTHSLLIDFTDLADQIDLNFLGRMFRKPQNGQEVDKYRSEFSIEIDKLRTEKTINTDLARTILLGLYHNPNRMIRLPSSSINLETTLFSIWSQQWPRLRRSFSFCTHTTKDRSTPSLMFDLQFSKHPFSSTAGFEPDGGSPTIRFSLVMI